jgi:hypothetical protein
MKRIHRIVYAPADRAARVEWTLETTIERIEWRSEFPTGQAVGRSTHRGRRRRIRRWAIGAEHYFFSVPLFLLGGSLIVV